ncbi:hypothetical protein C5167_036453 [Papaver somniferum]|uniref:RED-like N-terminal domain-containing protein n=1 Tax=Papaver somniferum TaxID=3469 RepID=A0A4Y7I436_PAPSO|nr:hypothetical protein C5167_036453 [Papaver somniferum]
MVEPSAVKPWHCRWYGTELGDVEHTHLVKGLDFALLNKVRSEIKKPEEVKFVLVTVLLYYHLGEISSGVLAKIDLMDKGTDVVDGNVLIDILWVHQILEGKWYQLQFPWIGVVNRYQDNINIRSGSILQVPLIAGALHVRALFQDAKKKVPDSGSWNYKINGVKHNTDLTCGIKLGLMVTLRTSARLVG